MKFYRGPLINAPCQISVHFAKRFQRRRFFLFQPNGNKNRPYLSTNQDQMRKLYTGPLIDASCQISVHLAKRFQRRLKCEKLTDGRTDNGRQVMTKAR